MKNKWIKIDDLILYKMFFFKQQIPQMAQMITPNGQIQQLQIASLPQGLQGLQSLQVNLKSKIIW